MTPKNILPHLRHCGYRRNCLRENYVYVANAIERQIAAVGFAREYPESANACIAVLDGNKIAKNKIANTVLSHRELGAPAILVCRKDNLHFWHFREKQEVQKENC